MSYITSPDRTVRLRAVDVIKARYPDDKMPPAIQRVVAGTVAAEASIRSETRETRRLVANAVRVLEKLPQADATVTATLQRIPPAAYPPTILAAPKMLATGDIRGANFGATRGQVYVHPRVVLARRSGDNAVPNWIADKLLGGLTPTNFPRVDDSYVEKWGDSAIHLKVPDSITQS